MNPAESVPTETYGPGPASRTSFCACPERAPSPPDRNHPPARASRRRGAALLPVLAFALAAFTAPATVQAQSTGTVRGTATDATSGRPLGAVQVYVVGTERGALSRADGEFLVPGVPSGTRTIRATLIGYGTASREVNVEAGGTLTVDFALSPSAIDLQEVVVTGSGASTERRRLGNSLATIDVGRTLAASPVAGFENLMQARMPGVQILPSGGTVGSSGLLRVRGVTSLSQTSSPLIYIDGVRVDVSSGGPSVSGQSPSRMLDIIPADIERIEVIKGAAAATLYGTEASNGVIQLFTRRGQAGAPRWNLQTEHGVERIPANFPGKLYPNFVGPTGVRARDTNDLIGTGFQQSYALSMSGGADALNYYVSGTYRNDEGSIVPEVNWLRQGSLRMNLAVLPSDNLSLRVNMGYVNTNLRLPNNDNSVFGVSGNATAGVPYQATEERRWGENFLPVAEAMRIENLQHVDRFTGGITAEHRPREWLNHRLVLGMDIIGQEDTEFFPYGFNGPQFPTGRKVNARRSRSNVTVDYRAAATHTLSEGLTSTLAAGVQGAFINTRTTRVDGRNFPGPGLSTASSGAVITGAEGRVEEVNAGIFLEETLGIGDRLFLTGGVRVDGNSAFGDDFRYQAYPKASVAYNISEEAFWPTAFLPTMKLRVAFGMSGLAPAQFAADRTWTPTSVLDGIPAVTPGNLGNTDLAPERSQEIEVGFDAGLLDNRMALVVTYYQQKTDGALLGVPSAPSLGFTSTQLANIGEVRNRGLEVELTNFWMNTPTLGLETTISLTAQENEVVSLGGRPGFNHGGTASRAEEGYPISGKWLVGELTWDPVSRTHTRTSNPVYVGPSIPPLRGAFSTSLTLGGNLTLSGLADWATGHYIANVTRQFQTQGRTGDHYLALVAAPNGAPTPAADSLVNYVNTMGASSFISAADFLKLRELSLSWRVPQEWAARMAMSSLSVRIAGRNLYTFTRYDGVDPEVNTTGAGSYSGAEFYTVPPARRLSLSLSTSF